MPGESLIQTGSLTGGSEEHDRRVAVGGIAAGLLGGASQSTLLQFSSSLAHTRIPVDVTQQAISCWIDTSDTNYDTSDTNQFTQTAHYRGAELYVLQTADALVARERAIA